MLETSYDVSHDDQYKEPHPGFGSMPVLDSDGPVEDSPNDEAKKPKEEEKILNADIMLDKFSSQISGLF